MSMDLTPEEFNRQIDELQARLVSQGRVVVSLVDAAIQAFYDRNAADAEGIAAEDDRIDRADVEIERESVELLMRSAACACPLDAKQIRRLLTIVKINNELERIADAGADIAELVVRLADPETRFPETTKVMTNSVVGLVGDAVSCYESFNPETARVVLQSEHVMITFKAEILQKAEQRVADSTMPVDSAFNLHELVSLCMLIADHCTNIAEQIIYQESGLIVRHMDGTWEEREAEGNG